MAERPQAQLALGNAAARQLANATKTVPQLATLSPRWLIHLLQWVPVEAGVYRLNKVKNPTEVQVACAQRDSPGQSSVGEDGGWSANGPEVKSARVVH